MTPDGDALRIDHLRQGSACVVIPTGRIDSTNAGRLLDTLRALGGSAGNHLVVDLSAVLYLTSAAFRVLLVASDETEGRAGRFILCGLAGHVRELFEMGGLLEAFAVQSTREAALATLD